MTGVPSSLSAPIGDDGDELILVALFRNQSNISMVIVFTGPLVKDRF